MLALASAIACTLSWTGQASAQNVPQVQLVAPQGRSAFSGSIFVGFYNRRTTPFNIDADSGRFRSFIDGQLVDEDVIDNTDAAREDLVFTDAFLGTHGGVLFNGPIVRDRISFFASAGAAIGSQEVSFVDPVGNKVTYSGTPVDLTFGAGISGELTSGLDYLLAVTGAHTIKTGATREPPINVVGGVATSDEAEFGRSSLAFQALVAATQDQFSYWAGLNMENASIDIDQRLEVDFSNTLPGLTSEFTGKTELSKTTVSALAGAGIQVSDSATAYVIFSIGRDQRQLSGGFTFNFR
jgi:hypothetical protein